MSPTRRGLAWLSHRCDGLIRTDWAQRGYYCGSDIVSSVGWLGAVAVTAMVSDDPGPSVRFPAAAAAGRATASLACSFHRQSETYWPTRPVPSLKVLPHSGGPQRSTDARAACRLLAFVAACGAYLRHPLQLQLAHSRLRYPSILVMEATENWEGHEGATAANCLTRTLLAFWHVLVDALARSRPIEIPHVLVEDTTQVRFAEDQHMVEAFTPDAPQQAFADRVLLVRQPHPVRRMEHNSSK